MPCRLPGSLFVVLFAAPGPGSDNDTYAVPIDARGRGIVAGRGDVRALGEGDGRADRAVGLGGGLKAGPMGLLWEGEELYAVADGRLKRYRGVDGSKPATNPD